MRAHSVIGLLFHQIQENMEVWKMMPGFFCVSFRPGAAEVPVRKTGDSRLVYLKVSGSEQKVPCRSDTLS